MAHELHNAKMFEDGGDKYLVGLDDHGYVQIQHGTIDHSAPEGASDKERFLPYEPGDDRHHAMLPAETALAMAEHIESIAR